VNTTLVHTTIHLVCLLGLEQRGQHTLKQNQRSNASFT